MTTPVVQLYWIPGCANCVRIKGYLKQRGVDFVAVNVQNDLEAVKEMRARNILGLPVVRRGDRYVPGADLAQVDELLGLTPDPAGRVLPVHELIERAARLSEIAAGYAEQIPPAHYDNVIPGMEEVKAPFIFKLDGTPHVPHRTWIALCAHVAGHAAKFERFFESAMPGQVDALEFAATQGEFSAFGCPEPSVPMAEIVAQLRDIARRLPGRAGESGRADMSRMVDTFYGRQTIHQVMQTMTCSLGQHTRQLRDVLDRVGVAAGERLRDEDIEGLVLPAGIWG
jgi:glutaredoxin 3